jgi:hypothetical protein
MADDQSPEPFYSPTRIVRDDRTPTPGRRIWTLQKRGHVLACELRDDSRDLAGADCQVFHDGFLMFSQRCPLELNARQLAETIRRDYERQGWTHAIDADPQTTA